RGLQQLLFGLLGGAGSVSLLKMDLSKPNNQMKVRLVGSSLLSVCSGCLIALLLAVVAKGWLLHRTALANSYEFNPQQLANVSDGIGSLVLRNVCNCLERPLTKSECCSTKCPRHQIIKLS